MSAETRAAAIEALDLHVAESVRAAESRAEIEIAALRAEVVTLQQSLADARKQYDDHMATHVVTPPPPPATTLRTMYGACPDGGGPASVITKYGSGASIRWFDGGRGLTNIPTRPSGTSKFHASWKPALGGTITDAQIIAAVANLRDGDIVEVWHEADVKYRKGSPLAPMLAMKNQFHDRVVALRDSGRIAKVLTCNTWAGWSVDATSSINPSNLHCRADLLGIDMDGINAQENFYPFFTRMMGTKFVTAYKQGGYTGWSVPEFCMPSIPSDPDSTRRVSWMKSEATKVAAGVPAQGVPAPHMIAWFDTAGIVGATERLTKANEIAAWSALVDTNT